MSDISGPFVISVGAISVDVDPPNSSVCILADSESDIRVYASYDLLCWSAKVNASSCTASLGFLPDCNSCISCSVERFR